MTEKRKTVSKDLNNQKILKEVQATSDEASRLLADLDSSSNKKSDNTKRNASQKTNGGPHQPYKYKPNLEEKYDPLGCNIAGIILISIIIFVPLINSLNKSTSTPKLSVPKSSATALTTKRQMNNTERSFYSKALRQAEDAVLIREHRSAISGLETLKRGKYKDLIGIDHGIVNNKIIQANKKIKFLDQPGDHKYWERSDYGVQWFDKGTGSHFRVFFAYSRKCKNPLVTFRISKESGSSNYKTYKVRPRENTSTLLVPFLFEGYQHINVLDFVCN